MNLFRIFTTYWRVRRKINELLAERIEINLKLKGMNIPSPERAKLSVRDSDLQAYINLLEEMLKR